ncbi:MAG: hypothetical protein ACREDH_10320, partial [Methylocella sp.]
MRPEIYRAARTRLALKAEGGVLPLRWIVNGTPVGGPDLRRQAAWTPDGAGFPRISVIDGTARRTARWCASNRGASMGQMTVKYRGLSSSFPRAPGSSCR